MTTGERIKKQRMKRGLKQAELAEMIGCSKQVVSNIERNYSGCSSALVARIAEVFGIPADDLLIKEQPGSFFLTKEEKEFILQYRSLKPNEQRMLRCTLEAFLSTK